MGLLSRLKEKVKAGIGAVNEEAKHPGRPPAHKVSENVFHREEASGNKAVEGERKKNAGEDKPWYLDGSNDGWDDTNPNKEK